MPWWQYAPPGESRFTYTESAQNALFEHRSAAVEPGAPDPTRHPFMWGWRAKTHRRVLSQPFLNSRFEESAAVHQLLETDSGPLVLVISRYGWRIQGSTKGSDEWFFELDRELVPAFYWKEHD